MSVAVSILIPAHDEAGYIGACLDGLLGSVPAGTVEVIVIANGCNDDTAAVAQGYAERFKSLGWAFAVLDLAQGGKMRALNAGDDAATHAARVYLDADVIVSPELIRELAEVLDVPSARYASGTAQIAPARSFVTRAYARFWQRLPFVTEGVPGFGVFAVNAAGRDRWQAFPDIISDDTFVRLNFTPAERVKVPAPYSWPMIEGFRRLVKVRRRQDEGVREIAQRHAELLVNDDAPPPDTPSVGGYFLRDPVGFAVYGAVAAATRLPARGKDKWARGR